MSTNRTLRAVPAPTTDPAKPRTDTEEKLWQALRQSPGSTASGLSAAAGIGKSTAPKILARWEQNGLVARTPGIADGGSRPADRWSVVMNDVTNDQPTDNQAEPGQPEPDDQPTDDQPTTDQRTTDQPEVGSGQPSDKPLRLGPGALRGMVEDYLRDNSGEASPNAIGKALNRSSGAVHNALEKLVDSGYAMRTSDKPKKYSIATAEASPV